MNFEEVKRVIVNTIGCSEDLVTMEADLKEKLGVDSLDAVEINMAIEDACGQAIPDEIMAEMVTVGDIVRYMEKLKA